jgi:hypothetical protein
MTANRVFLWLWTLVILPALFIAPVVWVAAVVLGPVVVKMLGGLK